MAISSRVITAWEVFLDLRSALATVHVTMTDSLWLVVGRRARRYRDQGLFKDVKIPIRTQGAPQNRDRRRHGEVMIKTTDTTKEGDEGRTARNSEDAKSF